MTELTVSLRHAKRSNSKLVDLSNRQLSHIPNEVFTIRSIEILNISNNKILLIQSSICELYKLKQFNIENNCLIDLPEQLILLPKISILKLKGNPLHSKFDIILTVQHISNHQKLVQVLQSCFDYKKSQTPSWLTDQEPQKKSQTQTAINWDTTIFKGQQKFSKTSQGRRNNTQKPLSIQQSNEIKNGVLQIKIEQLQIGQQISMGGFSTIHRGEYQGLEVAVKKIFNPNITQELRQQFQNQLTMLSKYRHPNIVLLIGAITKAPSLCIIMQYINQGTLYDILHRKHRNLSQAEQKHIAKELLQVLTYLHNHGIVHRDIKSHNILLDSNFHVKLCDFGLARHLNDLNTGPMQFCGTPTYMAQQLFLKKAYDQSIDVFAIGTLLYELYTGEIPYIGVDPSDIKDKVLNDSNLPSKVSIDKNILTIINKCRSSDVSMRPKMSQLLHML